MFPFYILSACLSQRSYMENNITVKQQKMQQLDNKKIVVILQAMKTTTNDKVVCNKRHNGYTESNTIQNKQINTTNNLTQQTT